jgi:hypothetical protein
MRLREDLVNQAQGFNNPWCRGCRCGQRQFLAQKRLKSQYLVDKMQFRATCGGWPLTGAAAGGDAFEPLGITGTR